MNTRIKVKKSEVKDLLKMACPEYTGRTIEVEFTNTVFFSDTNWGGGTRNTYTFLHVTGELRGLPNCTPWDNPFEGESANLPEDVLVFCHKIFCGHDLGITIYAHPIHSPKWLTA